MLLKSLALAVAALAGVAQGTLHFQQRLTDSCSIHYPPHKQDLGEGINSKIDMVDR